MRRIAVTAGIVFATLAASAGSASATSECRGLRVCVAVPGPWVVTTTAGTEFQLACPKGFIVGGLDAELSSRSVEIAFVGALGSPVNPGVTTTGAAVFVGRLVDSRGIETFRPHLGCIPASGGGQRAPTAYRAFKPGKPTMRVVKEVMVLPSFTVRLVARCPAGRRLLRVTHALAFYRETPPPAGLVRSIHLRQVVRSGGVQLSVRAGPAPQSDTIVQVDLTCAATG